MVPSRAQACQPVSPEQGAAQWAYRALAEPVRSCLGPRVGMVAHTELWHLLSVTSICPGQREEKCWAAGCVEELLHHRRGWAGAGKAEATVHTRASVYRPGAQGPVDRLCWTRSSGTIWVMCMGLRFQGTCELRLQELARGLCLGT